MNHSPTIGPVLPLPSVALTMPDATMPPGGANPCDPLDLESQFQVHPASHAPNEDSAAQRKRAADRGRNQLQRTVVPSEPNGANRLPADAAKAAALVCDGLASALNCTDATLANASLIVRSIASGAAWSAAGVFDIVSSAASAKRNSVVRLAGGLATAGAGAASMATTVLSRKGVAYQDATIISATSSNSLWGASGLLATASAIQDGYNRYRRAAAGRLAVSTLTYTALALRAAGGLANATAAGTGIRSTFAASDEALVMQRLSAGLWLAGTAFEVSGAVLWTLADQIQTPQPFLSASPR